MIRFLFQKILLTLTLLIFSTSAFAQMPSSNENLRRQLQLGLYDNLTALGIEFRDLPDLELLRRLAHESNPEKINNWLDLNAWLLATDIENLEVKEVLEILKYQRDIFQANSDEPAFKEVVNKVPQWWNNPNLVKQVWGEFAHAIPDLFSFELIDQMTAAVAPLTGGQNERMAVFFDVKRFSNNRFATELDRINVKNSNSAHKDRTSGKFYSFPGDFGLSDQPLEWLKSESRLGSWILKQFQSADEAAKEGNRRVVQRWIADPNTTQAQFTNALFAAIDNGQKEIEHDLLTSRFVSSSIQPLVQSRHELVKLEIQRKEEKTDGLKMHEDQLQRFFHLSAYFGKTQNLQDLVVEYSLENVNTIHFDQRIKSRDIESAAMTAASHGDVNSLRLLTKSKQISLRCLELMIHETALIDGDAPVMKELLTSELLRKRGVREKTLNQIVREIITTDLAQHAYRHEHREELRNMTLHDESYMKLDALLVLIKDNTIKFSLREQVIQMAIENLHPSDHAQIAEFRKLSSTQEIGSRAFRRMEASILQGAYKSLPKFPIYNDQHTIHSIEHTLKKLEANLKAINPIENRRAISDKTSMLNALYQHRINYLKSRMSVQMAWQGETESIVHVFESSRLMPERVFDELVVIAFSTENQHLKDYLAKDTRWVVSLQDAKKVSSKSNNSVVYNGIIAYEQSLQPSVASSWLRNQFVAVWPRVAQWISSTQTQNQPKATLIEDHIIAPQAKTQTYELADVYEAIHFKILPGAEPRSHLVQELAAKTWGQLLELPEAKELIKTKGAEFLEYARTSFEITGKPTAFQILYAHPDMPEGVKERTEFINFAQQHPIVHANGITWDTLVTFVSDLFKPDAESIRKQYIQAVLDGDFEFVNKYKGDSNLNTLTKDRAQKLVERNYKANESYFKNRKYLLTSLIVLDQSYDVNENSRNIIGSLDYYEICSLFKRSDLEIVSKLKHINQEGLRYAFLLKMNTANYNKMLSMIEASERSNAINRDIEMFSDTGRIDLFKQIFFKNPNCSKENALKIYEVAKDIGKWKKAWGFPAFGDLGAIYKAEKFLNDWIKFNKFTKEERSKLSAEIVRFHVEGVRSYQARKFRNNAGSGSTENTESDESQKKNPSIGETIWKIDDSGLFSGIPVPVKNNAKNSTVLIDGNKLVARLQSLANSGSEELKRMTQNERMLIFKGLVTAQLSYDQTKEAIQYLAKAAQFEHQAKAFPKEFGKFFSVLLVLELHRVATRDDVTMAQFVELLQHGPLEVFKLATFSATAASVTTGWGMAEQLVATKLHAQYQTVLTAELKKVPKWQEAFGKHITTKHIGRSQVAMLAAIIVNQMIYGPKMSGEELLVTCMRTQAEFFIAQLTVHQLALRGVYSGLKYSKTLSNASEIAYTGAKTGSKLLRVTPLGWASLLAQFVIVEKLENKYQKDTTITQANNDFYQSQYDMEAYLRGANLPKACDAFQDKDSCFSNRVLQSMQTYDASALDYQFKEQQNVLDQKQTALDRIYNHTNLLNEREEPVAQVTTGIKLEEYQVDQRRIVNEYIASINTRLTDMQNTIDPKKRMAFATIYNRTENFQKIIQKHCSNLREENLADDEIIVRIQKCDSEIGRYEMSLQEAGRELFYVTKETKNQYNMGLSRWESEPMTRGQFVDQTLYMISRIQNLYATGHESVSDQVSQQMFMQLMETVMHPVVSKMHNATPGINYASFNAPLAYDPEYYESRTKTYGMYDEDAAKERAKELAQLLSHPKETYKQSDFHKHTVSVVIQDKNQAVAKYNEIVGQMTNMYQCDHSTNVWNDFVTKKVGVKLEEPITGKLPKDDIGYIQFFTPVEIERHGMPLTQYLQTYPITRSQLNVNDLACH